MADRGNVKGFNGVSYGAIVTVVAQDATDDKVQGTFAGADSGLPYALAFSVKVLRAGVFVPLVDAVLTFNSPNNGDWSIEDGGATFVVTADDVIHIVAQPSRAV